MKTKKRVLGKRGSGRIKPTETLSPQKALQKKVLNKLAKEASENKKMTWKKWCKRNERFSKEVRYLLDLEAERTECAVALALAEQRKEFLVWLENYVKYIRKVSSELMETAPSDYEKGEYSGKIEGG